MNAPAPNSPFVRRWQQLPNVWHEWNDDTFAIADAADRPVLLTIGYRSCYWCERMATDVFNDRSVVAAIEADFVAVVVDRDERPDIDNAYMTTLRSLHGVAGWPLVAIVDQHRRPIWINTFVPASSLIEMLTTIAATWRSDRDQLLATASNATESTAAATAIAASSSIPSLDEVNDGLIRIASTFDPEWGGFGEAPKFPNPQHVRLVLRAAMATEAPEPRHIATVTLNAMAAGGIYDQIGGGFHRFSTDREWLVPRFEKVLADQAQLVAIYQEAFALWGAPLHRRVMEETIAYVLNHLQMPNGGFASSQAGGSPDADGIRRDGAFYTWRPNELDEALSHPGVGHHRPDVQTFLDYYDITDRGHLDGRSIPNRRAHRDDQLRSPAVAALRTAIYELRNQRVHPERDDTVITEHHALMTHSLAGAATFMRHRGWRAAAVQAGEFMLEHLADERGWFRCWDGTARGDALAGDYAAGVLACLRLGDLTGSPRWIDAATRAADLLLDNFFDPVDGGLWSTPERGEQLFLRIKNTDDRGVPSPNALAAEGLMKLAALTGELRYLHHAERILQLLGGAMPDRSASMPSALLATELFHRGLIQVVIVGADDLPPQDWLPDDESETARMIRLLLLLWRPNFVGWWGHGLSTPLTEGRDAPGAYICRDFATLATADNAEALFTTLTGSELAPGQRLDL